MMPDASSNSRTILDPLLCRPANASRLLSHHVTASQRHVRTWLGSVEWIDVPCTVNQGRNRLRRAQRAISGHVLVRTCCSVFAVSTTFVSGQVVSAHSATHDSSADLPTPWPVATALSTGINAAPGA